MHSHPYPFLSLLDHVFVGLHNSLVIPPCMISTCSTSCVEAVMLQILGKLECPLILSRVWCANCGTSCVDTSLKDANSSDNSEVVGIWDWPPVLPILTSQHDVHLRKGRCWNPPFPSLSLFKQEGYNGRNVLDLLYGCRWQMKCLICSTRRRFGGHERSLLIHLIHFWIGSLHPSTKFWLRWDLLTTCILFALEESFLTVDSPFMLLLLQNETHTEHGLPLTPGLPMLYLFIEPSSCRQL